LKIIVGDPISTAGLTTRDSEALTNQMVAAITDMYYRHSVFSAKEEPIPEERT
jgi:1-acyl-sn-glycerol-3-phosphate acyltransferase